MARTSDFTLFTMLLDVLAALPEEVGTVRGQPSSSVGYYFLSKPLLSRVLAEVSLRERSIGGFTLL